MEIPLAVAVEQRALISHDLARRIRSAYLHAAGAFTSSGNSMWTAIRARQQNIHDLLIGGDLTKLVLS